MTNSKRTGLTIAAAAAALFASGGYALADHHEAAGTEAMVHCSGVNACKGQAECKSASNSCKGQNSCKGKGWMAMTKADCDAKGGTMEME